jgi:hypothetical protein
MTNSEKFKEWLETDYYSAKNRGPITSGKNYVKGIENINGTLKLNGILKPHEDIFDISNGEKITLLYDKYMALPNRHKDYSSHFQSFLHFKEIDQEKAKGKIFNRIYGKQNQLKKQQVEINAIIFVTQHFSNLKYSVSSKEKDNLGWDLEAVKGETILYLEVKGLSGNSVSVDLSPNEYSKSQQHSKNYRICIVTNALTEPQLFIFNYVTKTNKWTSETGQELELTEKTAAKLKLKP